MNNQNAPEGRADQEATIQAKMAELMADRKRRKKKHLLEDGEYRQMALDALGIDAADAPQEAKAA